MKLKFLCRIFFSLLYAALAARFALRIFEPGTVETEMLFQQLEQVLPTADWVLSFFLLPVTLPIGWIEPILPPSITAWFPAVEAADFFEFIVSLLLWIPGFESTESGRVLLSQSYDALFPGVMDWRYPLALAFWGLVETIGTVLSGYAASLKESIQHHLTQTRIQQSHEEELAHLKRFQEKEAARSQPLQASSAQQDDKGEVRELINTFRKEINTLHDKVNLDALTRLYSRNYFMTAMNREIKRALEFNQYFGLILLDIDNFKKLNDTYGHLFGDEVLRRIGQTILQTVPFNEKALPCRYGGEEMGVVLINMDPREAVALAEQIRKRVSEIVYPDQPELMTTLSIGVFTIRGGPAVQQYRITPETVIKKTDELLYKAKQTGKNRVCSEVLS